MVNLFHRQWATLSMSNAKSQSHLNLPNAPLCAFSYKRSLHLPLLFAPVSNTLSIPINAYPLAEPIHCLQTSLINWNPNSYYVSNWPVPRAFQLVFLYPFFPPFRGRNVKKEEGLTSLVQCKTWYSGNYSFVMKQNAKIEKRGDNLSFGS